MQAYFWQANAKYFFAKCVVAIFDSKAEEGWGEIEISTKGMVHFNGNPQAFQL